MSEPMDDALRTHHLLIILTDWLHKVAERPNAEDVASAAHLADTAKASAARTVAQIDTTIRECAA